MKFIGQFIQNFIARFRSDVYLENISTGTIASGGNLGLDSNNKIVKAAVASGDITSVELAGGTGIDVTGVSGGTGGDYEATIAVDVSDFMSNGLNNRVLTATGGDAINAEANLTFDGNNLSVISASEAEPVLTLKTTHTTANRSGELQFLKDAADTGDGERLGLISFFGEDGGGNNTKFAHMQGKIAESDDGSEGGTIEFAVASHDGDMLAGLTITDGDQDAEVDVTVGGGNASVTTISGTLTMGSTATLNNSGLLQVANQSNITGVGTITSGVWNGTAIASAYLDSDTAHLSTQKHMTHHSFTADIDTTKHYVGLGDADSEATSTTGIDMPLVFPVASKLLQVTLRSNKNLSALTYTWRLETQATGVGFGTGPTIVGTQSGSGPAQTGHTIYDFTTSLDSGDNIVDAFDAVYLSLQSSGSTANTKYYITCVWETDMSGY